MKSIGSVKRHILRSLQEPISKMGMKSTEILNLVKDCPVGAETLVTRMLHILTEKGIVKSVRYFFSFLRIRFL